MRILILTVLAVAIGMTGSSTQAVAAIAPPVWYQSSGHGDPPPTLECRPDGQGVDCRLVQH